jgi:YesN/AraC family two-component response regulator
MCFLPEFALESYSVKAINYVLKPISKEKLFSIFDEVLEQINLEKKENAVIVKNNESIQRTLTSNLVFVEVIGRKALAQKVWLISWKNVAAYSSFRSRTNGLFFRLLYKKNKKTAEIQRITCGSKYLVRKAGLEPARLPTRS